MKTEIFEFCVVENFENLNFIKEKKNYLRILKFFENFEY
jgi:hypothetical protein